MGQTQILMLVLVMVLVGIAIMMAVFIFNENIASANLDNVTEHLLVLASNAQRHYRLPISMNGGGHSFNRLTANPQGMLLLTTSPTTEAGTFSVSVAGDDSKVTLQGVGIEDGDDDGTDCTVTCEVYMDSVYAIVVNR